MRINYMVLHKIALMRDRDSHNVTSQKTCIFSFNFRLKDGYRNVALLMIVTTFTQIYCSLCSCELRQSGSLEFCADSSDSCDCGSDGCTAASCALKGPGIESRREREFPHLPDWL
jgi:hypothetical protein